MACMILLGSPRVRKCIREYNQDIFVRPCDGATLSESAVDCAGRRKLGRLNSPC
jgi:hypothetical protein